jgi:hypothetical protein
MSVSTTITPNPNESYADFVYRAHYALMQQIPEPYARNNAVWSAWEKLHGDPVADQSQSYFPADQYRFVPKKVCYFREHSTNANPKQNKPARQYDFRELARICEAANERCFSDSYSAIASHHNSVSGPKGPENEPSVAGYMGEHRLGMINRNKPTWAIFVDEFHDKSQSDLFNTRRRRSVEVLQHRDGRPPFFDPVALLGSEAPRLPLPLAMYSAGADEFERYSYVSDDFSETDHYSEFATASGGNTYIPGGQSSHSKPNYPDTYSESQSMNLSPEDVQAITSALMATPQMRWVTEQMESAKPTSQSPAQQQNSPASHQAPNSPHPSPQPSHSGVQPGMGGGAQQYSQHYSANGQGESEVIDTERYAALENELDTVRENYSALEQKNGMLESAHKKSVEHIAELRKQLSSLSERNVDSDRSAVIRELYQAFPHMVDLEEELTQCLYSRGSTMTDDEFSRHRTNLEKYAKRSPVATVMAPMGSVGNSKPNDPIKEQMIADRVVERYSAEASRGLVRDYYAIEAEVRKELAG